MAEKIDAFVLSMNIPEHEKKLVEIYLKFTGVEFIEDVESKKIVTDLCNKLANELANENSRMLEKISKYINVEIERIAMDLTSKINSIASQ